ncbi:hypothetical protein [Paraburkholderia sp. HP33-1]|uniref:hypothetical protein n=1 Tax=Paraburkholderia sp. HP33-1 TaxID=2883243 RepID=UPI001F343BF7|nr:hypothetical protein [Paraburkholderia sp. HP33-1]
MYILDSDLRGPLADYTFDYRRQRAEKRALSSDESARAKQLSWAARVLGAMAPRIRDKMRTEGRVR